MDPQVAEKVCTIRAKVADRIGSSRYRTWFGDSTEFVLDGAHLDVNVANAFVGNWISSNYMPQLVDAARDVVGSEPRVRVRIGAPREHAGGGPAHCPPPTSARVNSALPPRRATEFRPTLRGELSTFVVGPSNELAHSVATAVARRPGEAFKHLVIHGGCGLGKTHLLQGICNAAQRHRPELQWQYVSGEEFTNEFIYAVKNGRVDAFRARFRNVDLLVIDDIHFLANKKATQDEFLHTFNAIDASGKTVILSTDSHPRKIATLSEPLINRLVAAMIVRINPPDYATRREILRRRAAAMACQLPEEILDCLAREITRNVRELEGALYKLVAYASLTKHELTVDLARHVVQDYAAARRAPEAADIERMVAKYFGVSVDAVRSTSRDRTVTQARGFAMYLTRTHTKLSFPEIGRALGNKQHSTVLMATRRIEDLIQRNGAVTWRTSAGPCEMPARELLAELEQRLARERADS